MNQHLPLRHICHHIDATQIMATATEGQAEMAYFHHPSDIDREFAKIR